MCTRGWVDFVLELASLCIKRARLAHLKELFCIRGKHLRAPHNIIELVVRRVVDFPNAKALDIVLASRAWHGEL